MLKTILTAKAVGKGALACICPIVLTAGVVEAVPSVRKAIHEATKPHTRPGISVAIPPPALPVAREVAAQGCPIPLQFDAPERQAQTFDAFLMQSGAQAQYPASFEASSSSSRAISPTAAVPEPSTWIMGIGGIAMIGAMMRRRRAPREARAGE